MISSYDALSALITYEVRAEIFDDLNLFKDILTQANENMNLVGPKSLDEFWSRHVLDSAQLLNHAPEAVTWADLGAGAGFPGLILAIYFKHAVTPKGQKIYLIDSLQKRCRFLERVVAELSLPAEVINARVESLDLTLDVITARAFAPLSRLLNFTEKYFENGAEAWLLKGERIDFEIDEASHDFSFSSQTMPSLSDPRGAILHISSISRVRTTKTPARPDHINRQSKGRRR